MHHYALSVIHPVERVDVATRFFVETLGFAEKEVSETFAVVENGALQVRLVAAKDRRSFANWPLELEVVTEDIDASCRELTRQGNVWKLTDETQVSVNRIEKRLGTAQGIVIVLTRVLSEDDLGILPDLPTRLPWEEDADRLIRRVLRNVPLEFRRSARARATASAEACAVVDGALEVGLETAVRGILGATPAFQQPRLLEFLAAEGVDDDLLPDAGRPQ